MRDGRRQIVGMPDERPPAAAQEVAVGVVAGGRAIDRAGLV